MYTTTVGKTFLAEYNRRHNTDYSAEGFFEEVMHPLFFGHDKYMFWATNSPFVQGKKKGVVLTEEMIANKLNDLKVKISNGLKDASIAISYPASETKEFATTSGGVTDIDFEVESEEVYASWIGAGLSLGVAGGYALLFNDPEITYATFEGWKVYRQYLNDPTTERLPPNKIVTWNGQWLTFRMSKRDYKPDFDFVTLEKQGFVKIAENTIDTQTVAWSKLFFSLSRNYPNQVKTAYVFALGQTNKTIGFIPFQFQKGRKLHEVYDKIFGDDDFQINANDFEVMFGKHIKRACELGNIGLQALQPKDLEKYLRDPSKTLKFINPKPQKGNESDEDYTIRKQKETTKTNQILITFQTYKTWLMAMISKNKEEISDYTRNMGKVLVDYRAGAKKTDRKNLIEKELFASVSKTKFLEALIKIVTDDSVDIKIVEQMNELRDKAHFMTQDDFRYFVLLLKFDYAYAERNSN